MVLAARNRLRSALLSTYVGPATVAFLVAGAIRAFVEAAGRPMADLLIRLLEGIGRRGLFPSLYPLPHPSYEWRFTIFTFLWAPALLIIGFWLALWLYESSNEPQHPAQ